MGSSHKNQFASAVRHFVRSKTNRSNRSQKALNGAIFETLEGRRLFSTGTFTVTNPSADGTGTLGWAIGQADVDTVDSTVNIDFDTSLTEHGAANLALTGTSELAIRQRKSMSMAPEPIFFPCFRQVRVVF